MRVRLLHGVTAGVQMYYTFSRQHMCPALWEGRPAVPIMAPASTCFSRTSGRLIARRLPPHCRPVAADSGGFVFASRYPDYPFTTGQYLAWLDELAPDWAVCMDYPVEREVAPDDHSVRERQLRTLLHAHTLLCAGRPWQWVPVLQGRTLEHYLRHAEMYRAAGLQQPYMGIGSLCRRTKVGEIETIAAAMSRALPGTRFHLFGVKLQLFKRAAALPAAVVSADSAAWNGLFGSGRLAWQRARAERGLTQREYEREQLYVYRTKVEAALARFLPPRGVTV